MIATTSMSISPMRLAYIKWPRQWSNLETSATTLRRCEAGRSDQSISKRDAMSTNAALNPSASSSRNRATTRMKKVSVAGSSNCWDSRILAPDVKRAVLTAETIPGRYGDDKLSKYFSEHHQSNKY